METDYFVKLADAKVVKLDERVIMMMPRRFSTGSCGWFYNGPCIVDELPVQVTISVVVKNSKGWDGSSTPERKGRHVQNATASQMPLEAPQTSPEEELTPQALYRLPEAPEVPGDLPGGSAAKKTKQKKRA